MGTSTACFMLLSAFTGNWVVDQKTWKTVFDCDCNCN